MGASNNMNDKETATICREVLIQHNINLESRAVVQTCNILSLIATLQTEHAYLTNNDTSFKVL